MEDPEHTEKEKLTPAQKLLRVEKLIDDEASKKKYDEHFAAVDHFENMKKASMSTKSIYSACYIVDHLSHPKHLISCTFMLILAVFIQVGVPAIWLFSLQPIQNVNTETYKLKACPNRGGILSKLIGIALCCYFVVLSIALCLTKLRGLMFLRMFVNIESGIRTRIVELGIMTYMTSLLFAGGAQFIIFIGNGEKYVSLVLQSLALQFCLDADSKLMSDTIGSWIPGRVKYIVGDITIYEENKSGTKVPSLTMVKTANFLLWSEKMFLCFVVVYGLACIVGLGYCI